MDGPQRYQHEVSLEGTASTWRLPDSMDTVVRLDLTTEVERQSILAMLRQQHESGVAHEPMA
jgi:hypothetical protein